MVPSVATVVAKSTPAARMSVSNSRPRRSSANLPTKVVLLPRLAAPTAGELEDSGLFYAYAGDPPWPGRIRFVPFAELPLSLSSRR